MTVGPYTTSEWAARGEVASGKGAFLRLNKTAYVAAVENGDHTQWRLEDVASRTGNGRLATGTSRTLEDARSDVAHALADRYPALTTETATEPTVLVGRGGTKQLDRNVASLADSDTYTRAAVLDMLGDRLTDDDRTVFLTADPTELARMLGSAGSTAATTVAVLHADGCPAVAIRGTVADIGCADGKRHPGVEPTLGRSTGRGSSDDVCDRNRDARGRMHCGRDLGVST